MPEETPLAEAPGPAPAPPDWGEEEAEGPAPAPAGPPPRDMRALTDECFNFNILLCVPHHACARVDAFFEAHEAFMRATHARPGARPGAKEPAPLMYCVMRRPEPVSASEPAKGYTVNTLYSLCETYASVSGCDAHMAAGMADAPLFAEFQDIVKTYACGHPEEPERGSAVMMSAPIVHTMAEPLVGTIGTIDKHCHGFQVHLTVPSMAVKEVDAFFEEHREFMQRTHAAGKGAGDEPCVLYYSVAKSPEPKPEPKPVDPNEPAEEETGEEAAAAEEEEEAGGTTTGRQLYALTELYAGLEGCAAHMAAGQAEGEFFGRFTELVETYGTGSLMSGQVICNMWAKSAWQDGRRADVRSAW